MKVEDLAMEVMRIVNGGDTSDDNGFVLLDYVEAVQQAASYIIVRDFWGDSNKTGETEINYNYLEVFEDVEVKYNSVRDCYYCDLPTDIISLPQDFGVQYVSERQNLTDPYTRTQIGTISFYSNLPDDVTSWMLTNKTIQFVNFDSAVKNVTLGLIPAAPTNINADDSFEVKEMAVKQMMKKVAEDKVNNSNPNE